MSPLLTFPGFNDRRGLKKKKLLRSTILLHLCLPDGCTSHVLRCSYSLRIDKEPPLCTLTSAFCFIKQWGMFCWPPAAVQGWGWREECLPAWLGGARARRCSIFSPRPKGQAEEGVTAAGCNMSITAPPRHKKPNLNYMQRQGQVCAVRGGL